MDKYGAENNTLQKTEGRRAEELVFAVYYLSHWISSLHDLSPPL